MTHFQIINPDGSLNVKAVVAEEKVKASLRLHGPKCPCGQFKKDGFLRCWDCTAAKVEFEKALQGE